MMRFKADVRIGLFDARVYRVLAAACAWSLSSGVDVKVTSMNDGAGVHQAGSLHGYDLAVDLDAVTDAAADTRALGEYLRRQLEPGYDVVLEVDHVHVEYDAHRPPLRATT